MLTTTEETVLKKWIAWQSQAAKTNAISTQMEARQNALKTELGRPLTNADLTNDPTWSSLKSQHDTEADKCNAPFADFKATVKEAV